MTYAVQYAKSLGTPLVPHLDYSPGQIAGLLGRDLEELIAHPDSTQDVRDLATHILTTGQHDLHPMLADALDDNNHPLAAKHDWRSIPAGIALDKTLRAAIQALPAYPRFLGDHSYYPSDDLADPDHLYRAHSMVGHAYDMGFYTADTLPATMYKTVVSSLHRLQGNYGRIAELEHTAANHLRDHEAFLQEGHPEMADTYAHFHSRALQEAERLRQAHKYTHLLYFPK